MNTNQSAERKRVSLKGAHIPQTSSATSGISRIAGITSSVVKSSSSSRTAAGNNNNTTTSIATTN